MFYNMKVYYDSLGRDPFTVLPTTFHIAKDDEGASLLEFQEYYESSPHKIWIVKPAQNSNQGCGINVYNNLEQIQKKVTTGKSRSYVVQRYLENPLLINKRKFDIR